MTDSPALEPKLRGALGRMKLRAGASDEEVRAAMAVGAWRLPDDYLLFLRASDGAEGWVGENYLHAFRAGEAAETTKSFGEFVRGIFFFASDGSEALFGFDLRTATPKVVIAHTDEMDFEGLVTLAESFTAFIIFLSAHDWMSFWSAMRDE